MATKPKPTPKLAREAGYATGVQHIDGTPVDPGEEAFELSFPQSIAVFDRMRRTDGQIAAVFRAVRLSLGRLAWHVDPQQADEEVVRFVSTNLGVPILGDTDPEPPKRRRGRFSFSEHMALAQLALAYGFMPFEQVYRLTDREGNEVKGATRRELMRMNGVRAQLRKLAPRLPPTIAAINVDDEGGLQSVEQYPKVGSMRDQRRQHFENIVIPVNRLVMYSHDREGGIWQGQSILRPVYKHWLLKDRLMRIDTSAAARNGMGVPWITAEENADQDQIDEYARMAAAFRAGDEAGGAGPYGSKLELVGVSGQIPNVLERIKYHDEQIAQNMFAQFLRLGQTATGSRALGESFIDFFMVCIDAIAGGLADTFTKHVVEDLVDVNFGLDEAAPALVPAPAKERKSLSATELIALAQAGLLRYDPDLEAYVRERYGLPARDPNAPSLPLTTQSAPNPRQLPPGEGQQPEAREPTESEEGDDDD